MKELKFRIRYDEEWKDYYFTPFKDRSYYVWINDIFETDKGLYAITDDYGDLKVKEIDWEEMKVIIII